jgi:hypothetical protein
MNDDPIPEPCEVFARIADALIRLAVIVCVAACLGAVLYR